MSKKKSAHIKKMTAAELLALLEEQELTHQELADLVGTSQPAVSQMCAGTRPISAKMTTRVLEALAWYNAPTPPEQREKERQQIAQILRDLPEDIRKISTVSSK